MVLFMFPVTLVLFNLKSMLLVILISSEMLVQK
jgi:hypothetical protein